MKCDLVSMRRQNRTFNSVRASVSAHYFPSKRLIQRPKTRCRIDSPVWRDEVGNQEAQAQDFVVLVRELVSASKSELDSHSPATDTVTKGRQPLRATWRNIRASTYVMHSLALCTKCGSVRVVRKAECGGSSCTDGVGGSSPWL